MFLSFFKSYKGLAVAVGLAAMTLSSCDSSFVYEDLRPCIPQYMVKLSYSHNLANENRVEQVEAAEVYAFDADGNLVESVKADKQTLIDNDWTLPLNLERFQAYDLVVWGGLVTESPFALDGTRSVTSKEDLTCRLNTEKDEDGNEISKKTFPPLFHGTKQVTYSVEDGPEVYEAPLMKNTNTVNVIVRKKSGEVVEDGYYVVEVTDANGVMDHQNNVSGENVKYIHTSYESVELPQPNGEGGEAVHTTQAGHWQFHTARLMKNSPATIKINLGESGINLVNTKLVDLLLAAKAKEAPDMDDQEYLDRQDTYTIDFTLRVEENWSVFEIYVNNWIVVVNDIIWY